MLEELISMEKNDTAISSIVTFLLIGGLMLFIIIYGAYKRDEAYPEVQTKDMLQVKVVSAKMDRGVVRFGTTTGKKMRMPYATNMNYEKSNICDNVIRGDSIFKKPGSDTIKIKRMGVTYIYVAYSVIDKTSK